MRKIKIDSFSKGYITDQNQRGNVSNGVRIFWVTNHPKYGRITGEHNLCGEMLVEFEKADKEGEQAIVEFIRKVVAEILEIDLVSIDAYDFETIKRADDSRDKKLKDLEQQNLELALMISQGGEA